MAVQLDDWLQWKGGGNKLNQSEERMSKSDQSNKSRSQADLSCRCRSSSGQSDRRKPKTDQSDEHTELITDQSGYRSPSTDESNAERQRRDEFDRIHVWDSNPDKTEQWHKPHSMHDQAADTFCNISSRTQGFLAFVLYMFVPLYMLYRRHSYHFRVPRLVTLIVVFSCVSIVCAQECDPLLDCHPASQDLLDSTNPLRVLNVSSTCGVIGATQYQKASTEFVDTIFLCDANDPHPPEFMTDRTDGKIWNFTYDNPALETYWQSENTILPNTNPVEESVIALFGDSFLIRYMRAIFISPHVTSATSDSDMRPRAMVIEKKTSPQTVGWEPLWYYADNCARHFPDVPIQAVDSGPNYEGNVPVCMEKFFAGDSFTFSGWGYGRQEVKFSPSLEFEPEFSRSYTLQRHYMASALRLRFIQPADDNPLSSYYAIADLEIDGQCSCFGHAAMCTGTNEAQCVCQHNTEGTNCEECLPLFNNRPWQPGFGGQANACEDCGCNEHADICSYEAVKGYGVCQNCRDKTMGDKCDQCENFYYLNPDKDLYNATNPAPNNCVGFNGTAIETYYCGRWCIPCDCSQEGATAPFLCSPVTGECSCKQNVVGRGCNECRDEFWNLDASNPSGCQSCSCYSLGTVNNTNLCDKISGECICKSNTMGQSCDVCKPSFYELTFSDPDGCKPCGCDPGASITTICPPETGDCPCRDKIGGRTCNTPFINYFVPGLDHLTYEAEFTAGAETFTVEEQLGHGWLNGTVTGRGFLELPSGESLSFFVSVPQTTNYNIIMRYESPAAMFPGVSVTLQITNPESAGVPSYECAGQLYEATFQHTATNNLPVSPDNTGVIMTVVAPFCLLKTVAYTATVTLGVSAPALQTMSIDSLVLLPLLDDFTTYTSAADDVKANITQCYDLTLGVDLATREMLRCRDWGYAIMAELYQGAIECVCDSMGTVPSTTCEGVGGQCQCKPGVMLRDCSQCLVDHFGFTSGDGCTACECHPSGSIVTACNDTGICECHNNVVGTKCDACIPEHFGLASGQGCTPCVCNTDYSLNNSCADSGQCPCKPGVGGIECNRCLDGFYNLTLDGCQPCECDTDGSITGECTTDTGVCTCRDRATGDKCDTCKDGFYGLGEWNGDGCLACFCSGHSTNCSSAPSWYYAMVADSWSLLDGNSAIQGQWTGEDDLGNPIEVNAETLIIDISAKDVMRIINDETNIQSEVLYFLATEQYLGDKRGAYAQNLSVSLVQKLPADLPENATVEPVDGSRGDVILKGRYTTSQLVVALPQRPNDTVIDYLFELREEIWHVDTVAGRNPTYTEFMEVLGNLESIKVRAKYVNVTGAYTDLYSAVLFYADQEGTTPITNMEQCTCPPEYTGQFCEQCAVGYVHADLLRGPYSQCVPCECNNHAQPGDYPCDPDTGICNCTHNTTGNSCDLCAPGYYGDATMGTEVDCQPCLCPGNVAAGDVNTFASVCVVDPSAMNGFRCENCMEGHGGDHCEICVDQWFGQPEDPTVNEGRCLSCECNGRADTCNTTSGECVGCRNDTAGQECDICAPGFFGIAASFSCIPCTCDLIGATGECDHRNGDCVCKPNVVTSNPNLRENQCDRCALNTFNYESGLGCEACDCHEIGATSVSCDVVTGQCDCREQVIGRRCDACADTYWQITYDGCLPCECTTEGTLVVPTETFGTCDLVTGQCQCAREGIVGRTCDVCARGTTVDYTFVIGIFVGVYPECELCGECYDNWALKIDEIGIEMTRQYNITRDIWKNFGEKTYDELSPDLTYIREKLTDVSESINMAIAMVSDINNIRLGFDQIRQTIQNISAELDTIDQEAKIIRSDIDRNSLFTGLTQINATLTADPNLMFQLANATYTNFQAIYAEANATWEIIEEQTRLIQESNGNIDVFLTTVTTAMGVLAQARATRQAAEMITTGSLNDEFAINTVKLQQLQATVSGFPATISSITSELQTTNGIMVLTNDTVHSATTLVRQKKSEMEGAVVLSERAKFNATQARLATKSAQEAVDDFVNLANATKNGISGSLIDVAESLQSLRLINEGIARGYEMQANTSAIALRPLQDMLDITRQIELTAVSAADVEETLKAAEDGLQLAADAQNITEIAVTESTKSLELVQGIQYNLDQSESLRNRTRASLDQIREYNSSIYNIVQEVNQKAANAIAEEADTTRSINEVLNSINDVTQCFTEQSRSLNNILITLREANATAERAGQLEQSTEVTVANLTGPLNDKELEVGTSNSNINVINKSVRDLTAELDAITGITDLQEMRNEYNAQRLEMIALESQLDALEGQLDALLASLDLLDPATADCTLN